MPATYDTAVIGLGAAGSAALFNLAARGRTAIGFDQFEPGHDRGSSHGESRIIRLAYWEHPSYVPLLREAYEEWHRFERLDGGAAGSLLTTTGIIEAGCPGSAVVERSLMSSRMHDLPHTEMDGADINMRFPAFNLPHKWSGIFQPDGGFLRPEAAIRRFVAAAAMRGADTRTQTRVLAIEPKPGGILVTTDAEIFEVGSVIIAAGAWIGDFAPALKKSLTITRQVVGWFPPRTPALFSPDRCPVFLLESEEDHYYGFPNLAGTGIKAASHVKGRTLRHAEALDATDLDEDEARIARMFARFMPQVGGPATRLSPCMYTRTADGHFLIDRAPQDPRIVLASPCSGHGFKFASLFGQILADLADGKEPAQDISLFRWRDCIPAT